MARKPMVTRNLTSTEVTLLCLNITTGEPFNDTVTMPRTYKDDKKLLSLVQEAFDTDEVKFVHIVDKKEVETLYGMSETDFIKYATVLDPDTRRPVGTEEAEETEN